MGAGNAKLSHPSLAKRGEGRFCQGDFKIPLYPSFQRGIKIPVPEGVRVSVLRNLFEPHLFIQNCSFIVVMYTFLGFLRSDSYRKVS
jgi:hypothetical protein